jgi:uncharacterized protein (DUF2252 family)
MERERPPERDAFDRGIVRSSAGLDPRQRARRGREARKLVPRSSHRNWRPAADRPDPIGLLAEQARTRVPELVPIRHGRMMDSPFAFLRGAAAVMAADLADTPVTGMRVQLCGDAHAGNFRGLASPERELVFDLNDFDETLPGPWEWDLKRLATSLVVAGRNRGLSAVDCGDLARLSVGGYREEMRELARMKEIDVWYARIDADEFAQAFALQGTRKQLRSAHRAIRRARRKDHARAFEKLGTRVQEGLRIAADPPLLVPVEDLVRGAEEEGIEAWIAALVESYRSSLQGSRRHLLDRYRYVHAARKVVGVGSVGMRAWVVLMRGRDENDVLFLQCKQAERSVLEPYAGRSRYANMGRRVAEGQWLIQAASDLFLGWLRATGLDGRRYDYYVRQLWDWKGKPDFDRMLRSNFSVFAGLCGRVLARSHGRSGDAVAIASYLGRGDAFDAAVASFADAYADQTERDHETLVRAVRKGRLAAEPGV